MNYVTPLIHGLTRLTVPGNDVCFTGIFTGSRYPIESIPSSPKACNFPASYLAGLLSVSSDQDVIFQPVAA